MPAIKSLAAAWLPPALHPPARRIVSRLVGEQARAQALTQRISPDGTVIRGPFQGTWIGHDTTWGGVSYYLAGTYEDELSPVIEAEIQRQPPTLVDIGAAEGYFAVGFARRSPATRVIASDVLASARERCSAIAAANDVAVEVVGALTPAVLSDLLVPHALVICDCEGCELELMDPTRVPELASTTLIVEVHDFVNPEISSIIKARFSTTHEVQFITAQPKTPRHYPHLASLSPADAWKAVQENRPCVMEWAVMTPRHEAQEAP